jgi:hypothetical protein
VGERSLALLLLSSKLHRSKSMRRLHERFAMSWEYGADASLYICTQAIGN